MKKKPTTISEKPKANTDKPKAKKIQSSRIIEASTDDWSNRTVTEDRSNRTVTEDGIRERAYHIWKDLGEPHGQETNHWVRAERELTSRV